MAYLLGIDAGTSALKVALFNEGGQAVAESNEEYSLIMPAIDMVELDAEEYWKACVRGIRHTVQAAQVDKNDINALSISSQGETFVPIGTDGRPLRNAIVESDNRSTEESELIIEKFGKDKLYEVTGQPYVFPCWMGTKILWLRNNEPTLFSKVHKYLLVEDYLLFRFTGEFTCEHSMICSSLFYDTKERKWWDEMLEFLNISAGQLGAVRDSGQVVAPLTPKAAEETGLSASTVAVTGALDQAAAMIGCGNIKPGIITESTGNVLAICATMDQYKIDPRRRSPIHCHAVPDCYYLLPWCRTAGAVLKWFRDEFCQEDIVLSRQEKLSSYALLNSQALNVPPGCEGLVMLPHLLGAIYPEFNAAARGVFFGITLQHTKAHFVRSIMESVAYMLRINLEVFKELGITVDQIVSLGGASRSELWSQIKADVTSKPLRLLEDGHLAPARGAAVLAGVAMGVYVSLEQACQQTIKVKKIIEPDSGNQEAYLKGYQTYLKLYETLEPLFK
ncbi:MAG: xylulokinase [Planctomycetota bacterium]|jgi:xylulokinase